MIKDLFPYPCCDQNKRLKLVVYKEYKLRKLAGFCVWSKVTNKWERAEFCPFCAKNVGAVGCLI